jgi:hypothetical protein
MNNNLIVNGSSVSGNDLVVTLPAVEGKVHYITAIMINKVLSAPVAAGTVGNFITATNLGGNFSFRNTVRAGSIGDDISVINLQLAQPIVAKIAGLATIFTIPSQANTIHNVVIFYGVDYAV